MCARGMGLVVILICS